MPDILMKCGCRATGVLFGTDLPSCLIHDCDEVAETVPDLSSRTARCASCDREVQSSLTLAFFEYRGPGSPFSMKTCICSYHDVAYEKPEFLTREGHRIQCRGIFTSRGPDDRDRYYCGCQGWD